MLTQPSNAESNLMSGVERAKPVLSAMRVPGTLGDPEIVLAGRIAI
jgi:hypothetical protein